MRDNELAIQIIHRNLLETANRDDLGFSSLRCDWGSSGSKLFGVMQATFCRSMRSLAKSCPVKWYCGNYYMFNGKFYEVCEQEVIEMAYQQLMEDFQIAPMMNRTSIRNEVFLRTIRLCNPLRPTFDVVAFANGVVDFGSGLKEPNVMPFSPEYHVTYYHPYDYNPRAKCDRWMNFIYEVLPDKTSRLILQMFLGLGLIQRGTAYNQYEGKESSKVELCLLLVGSGANGKSVIFDVACSLFGKDRISKMDYGDLTAEGDEGMRGRFPIRNAIFNWSSDTDSKKFGKKNTGMFKRLVSGEPVPMRELGKNVLESNTVPYLIFNLNDLPLTEDVSLGFIRRLQYVNFNVTVPKDRQDPELAMKIIRSELSGVFNWVWDGAMKLRKRKFRFPSAEGSKMLLLKSLLDSQPIRSWLSAYNVRECAEARGEQGVWVSAADLYGYFCRFCKDNNLEEEDLPSIQKFGRDMWSRYSFVRVRKPCGQCYKLYGVSEEDLKNEFIIGCEDLQEEESNSSSGIKDLD